MDIRIPMKPESHPIFCLLQISDPLFPIGGYTQSFGLETYVQKGLVHDAQSTREYLESYLLNNFLYNDLLAVKLAWEYADREKLEALCLLDRLLSAVKSAREIRNASLKLGARFSKLVEMVLAGNRLFDSFGQFIRNHSCAGHYSVVYGLSARLLQVDKTDALSAISYSTAASIVNNCAKLVPISQKDGQEILFAAHSLLQQLVDRVEVLDEDSIGICGFGFDLRSMQHERLYMRLFIS
ncbi:MAG TPA: urease accessory protein UreF [Syntrophomonadaceae bacterium]|nr:urease accessory protein UreF [Syntrophomonadaceae bacterium]